jgi:endonuclease/exonuclease/phosphatase family metal-dependent hydrolase
MRHQYGFWEMMLPALFLTVGMSLQAEESLRELRVLSYNIHIGVGMDGKLNLERTAKTILEQQPDIVALQEVDNKTERTKKADQTAELAKLTGMNAVFGRTIDLQGGEYGIAVLSKYPILEHKITQLPRLGQREDRGALAVKVRMDEKTVLWFVCTHFCNKSEERRLLQAQKINELFTASDDQLTILAGDLNTEPDSGPVAVLKKKWFNATNADPTLSNPESPVKIDYIFYRPESALRVKETRVLQDNMTSDHLPVLTVFEQEPKK